MSALGSVVTWANYLSETAICDVVAVTKVQAYWISAEVIRGIMMDRSYPDFQADVYKGSVLQFLKGNMQNSFDKKYDEEWVEGLLGGAELRTRGQGGQERPQLDNDVFLFRGQLNDVASMTSHNPFGVVRSYGERREYTTSDVPGVMTIYLEFDRPIDRANVAINTGKGRPSMMGAPNLSLGGHGGGHAVKNSIIAGMDSSKDISATFDYLVNRKYADLLKK
jgi:hypothetical protein